MQQPRPQDLPSSGEPSALVDNLLDGKFKSTPSVSLDFILVSTVSSPQGWEKPLRDKPHAPWVPWETCLMIREYPEADYVELPGGTNEGNDDI